MTESFRSPRHPREIVVADWQDAELLAAHHMRTVLAFADAHVTPSGADGGIDVVATRAAAQVKHTGKAIDSPRVQMMRGAAHHEQHVLFYSLNGYTAPAIAAAARANVALFHYSIYGDVTPVNPLAEALVVSSEVAQQTADVSPNDGGTLERPADREGSVEQRRGGTLTELVAAWWDGLATKP